MNKKKEDIIQYYKFCDKSYQHWSQTRKNKTYEIHYGFFDSNHKKHKESLINMNRVMANKLNLKSGWKILDAGCGVGASSIFMAKNYDGWTVKDLQDGHLSMTYLSYWRSTCIDKFNQLWGKGEWQKRRSAGELKLVKVKLGEVE